MTVVATPRRPRRIAADEAHSWARNLRLGNPYAKLVLSMLTIYVNGEGSCFVSAAALAEDCELALETVRRRLAWLEGIGAIARFPQWVDEHGRRNGEGKGRRTTDDIRLMIHSDPDEIEAKAHGNGDGDGPAGAEQAPQSDPLRQRGATADDESVSPLAAPSLRTGPNESEPEPEVSPPTPQAGGVGAIELSESFKPFAEAYPAPITDMGKALAVWSALTDTERVDATIGAKGYRSFMDSERKRGGKRAVKDAHRWLRDKLWIGYLDVGRQFVSAEAAPRPVTVDRDSREGRAAIALYAIARSVPPVTPDGEKIQLRVPLTVQALALADAPPQAEWPLLDLPQQAGAWLELMMPLIGRQPLVEDQIVGKRFAQDAQGNQIFAGYDKRRGFKAPWPWPPHRDGSIPTGPPDRVVRESEDEFQIT